MRKTAESNILIALAFAFTGSGTVQKYLGVVGVGTYTALLILLMLSIAKWGAQLRRVGERWFIPIASASAACLLVMFFVLNPWEDGKGAGRSSDRDEGLNLAVERVFRGETPYYPPDPTAGPLSVLPGAVILAVPFVWLQDSGVQNIFWLAVFFVAAWWHFNDRLLALGWLTLPVVISPAVAYEYISGGDLVANGIYVPISFLIAHRAFERTSQGYWMRCSACLFVGICLASRSNFPLLLPVFGGFVWRLGGWRQAVAATAGVCTIILLLTLPFYLHNPAGFTPLMSRHKLALVDHVFANTSWILAGVAAAAGLVAGLVLIWWRDSRHVNVVFRMSAAVTMLPMVLLVVLQSAVKGTVDMGLMNDRFGLLFLYSVLLGWGSGLLGPQSGKVAATADLKRRLPCA